MLIISSILFIGLCLFFSYLFLRYQYGNNPLKWRSILFSSDEAYINSRVVKKDGAIAWNKKNISILFIELVTPLAGALFFLLVTSSLNNFLLVGILSALINLIIFIYFTHNISNSKIVMILGGLTLMIPSFLLYALFSYAISGFQLPFLGSSPN